MLRHPEKNDTSDNNLHKNSIKSESPSPQKQSSPRKRNRYSKGQAEYWKERVFKQKIGTWSASTYSVRFQAHGKNRLITLKAKTQRDAAVEAKDLWFAVTQNGWDAAIPHMKRGKASAIPSDSPLSIVDTTSAPEKAPKKQEPTVGSLLKCYSENVVSTSEATRRAYVTAFRAIIADIVSIPKTGFKPQERNEKIDKVSLLKISREEIQKWIAKETRKCRNQSDRRTIRSRFVNAKSLFHKNALEAFNRLHGLSLTSPFTDISLPKTAPVRHFSKIDLGQLIEMAKVDLSGSTADFEQWKILILVISAGLRRNEVDKLRWTDIDLKSQKLHIRDAEGHTLKTSSSVASIALDNRTCEIISGWKSPKAPAFVISEAYNPSMKHMRCGDHFSRLCQWLRNLIVDGEKPLANVQKPLHELRKEAGSRVNELHGLHEACRFLRHTSINTTSDYYLNSDKVTVGMDALIEGEQQAPTNEGETNKSGEDILIISNDTRAQRSIQFVP